MTLFLNRNIDGAGLLECLMRDASEKAYSFFDGAPVWFYIKVAEYFQYKGDFIRHVLPFVHKDINNFSTSNALFREDCMTSKFLNNCSIGKEHCQFMRKTLAPAVNRVLDKKLQLFNIKNLTEGDNPNEFHAIIAEIRDSIDGILKRLYKHIDLCSVYYRTLLRNISAIVDEKFKDEAITRSITASFFFLRFICAALVSPVKYEVPKTKRGGNFVFFSTDFPLDATRSLVVISKILQAIGNGVGVEQSKEKWMTHFSALVAKHQENASKILDKLLNANEIASYLIQSKKVSLTEPMHMRKRLVLSDDMETYIRTTVAEDRSLEKYIYSAMRILPPSSDSHPVTWTESEIQIWLCMAGLELYSPTFLAGKVSGLALLTVDREKIRDEWGVPCFENQIELLGPLKKLLRDSFKYISSDKAEDPISKWNTKQITCWLDKTLSSPCPFFCSSLKDLRISGEQFLCLSEDDYCNLGLPADLINPLVLRIREMVVASQYEYIHGYYTKTFGNMSRQSLTPNVHDDVIDEWLASLDLSIEATRYLRKKKGSPVATKVAEPALSTVTRRKSALAEAVPTGVLLTRDGLVFGSLNRKIDSDWAPRWYTLKSKKGILTEYAKGISPLSHQDVSHLKHTLVLSISDCIIKELDDGSEGNFIFSLQTKKKTVIFQTSDVGQGKAWAQSLYMCKPRSIAKLNIQLFSAPIVLVDKASSKIARINDAARELFHFPDLAYAENKNKKILFPAFTNSSSFGDLNTLETIQLHNGDMLSVKIKSSEFIEGSHTRMLFILQRNEFGSPLQASGDMHSCAHTEDSDTQLVKLARSNTTPEYPGSAGFLSFINENEEEEEDMKNQRKRKRKLKKSKLGQKQLPNTEPITEPNVPVTDEKEGDKDTTNPSSPTVPHQPLTMEDRAKPLGFMRLFAPESLPQ